MTHPASQARHLASQRRIRGCRPHSDSPCCPGRLSARPQFADVLRARMRGEDLVARYGGEEFLVVLDGAGLEEASQIADEIRNRCALGAIDSPDGSPVSATVSAGCAAMGADLGTFSELISRADMALAIAKHGGRNRVVSA